MKLKKTIFSIITLFLISYSNLNADYLLTYYGNKCIVSYSIEDNSNYIDVVLSYSGEHKRYKTSVSNIHPGYYYDAPNNTCNLMPKLIKLGITYEDYNFLMGLLGLLMGFGFFVSVLKIFGRR